MNLSRGKKLGAAVMAFAAVAAVGGCSPEYPEVAGLSSQSEFQEQVESLLKKTGVSADALQEFEYFDEGPVAILKYGVSGEAGTGTAVVSCSSKETLHMGTHCMISSLKIGVE